MLIARSIFEHRRTAEMGGIVQCYARGRNPFIRAIAPVTREREATEGFIGGAAD